MALSRYNKRETIKNISGEYRYSNIFLNRGLKLINQYPIANLTYPTVDEIMNLTVATKVWTTGEKYYKLADEFYGDPEYWWVIAWYNQKPLESQVKAGDVVEIPLPIEQILQYYDVY